MTIKKLGLLLLLAIMLVVGANLLFSPADVTTQAQRPAVLSTQKFVDGNITYNITVQSDAFLSVNAVLQEIKTAKEKVCQLFSCDVDTPIIIRVMVTRGPPSRSMMINRGNVYDITVSAYDADRMRIILKHEIGHSVCRAGLCQNIPKLPIGLDEAFAIMTSKECGERLMYQTQCIRQITAGEFFDSGYILTQKGYPTEEQKTAFYAGSTSLVSYLILKEGGLEKFNKFTKGGIEKGFNEESFKAVYNMTFAQLDTKWQTWATSASFDPAKTAIRLCAATSGITPKPKPKPTKVTVPEWMQEQYGITEVNIYNPGELPKEKIVGVRYSGGIKFYWFDNGKWIEIVPAQKPEPIQEDPLTLEEKMEQLEEEQYLILWEDSWIIIDSDGKFIRFATPEEIPKIPLTDKKQTDEEQKFEKTLEELEKEVELIN